MIIPPLNIVTAGKVGQVLFQARDDEGRKRGIGGNTWNAIFLDADTNSPAAQGAGSPTIVDNGDGTYTINYVLLNPGRYIVQVACNLGSPPNVCESNGFFATLTNDLFVMS